MKTKNLAPLAAILLCAFAHAETKTWTGAANDNLWSTAANWNPAQVPVVNDSVVIDNAAVSCSTTLNVPSTVTLTGTASLTFTGNAELQFSGEGTKRVISGGSVTVYCVAQQGGSGVLELDGCALRTSRTDLGYGLWGNAPMINFASGKASSFAFNGVKSKNDVWNDLFAGGRFTLDDTQVSSQTWDDCFSVTDDGSVTTVTYTPATAAFRFTTPTATGVTASSATLSTTLRTLGEEEGGTVVVAYATTENGIDLANGAELDGALVENATFTTTVTGLAEGTTYYFAFGVKVDGAIVAQSTVSSFYASDYSAIFLGEAGDGQWTTAGNWVSGSVPTASDAILVAADCARSGNMSFSEWNVTVDGADFAVDGEVTAAARTVRNGSLSARIFVGSGTPIEVRGSDVVSTLYQGHTPHGFWATAPFFNFHSGAPCSYTYAYNPEGDAPDAEAEFTALFANGRILVDGAVLTDASRVTITTNTTDHTMTATLLASAVTASFEGSASATVNGLSATLSVTVEVGGGHALYALVGDDPANLTASLVAAEAADATTYTFAATGAEGALTYYQFRLGDGADAIYDSLAPQSFFATADGNVWLGTVSTLASVPANWSKGVVPGASDAVYVVKEKAIHDLEWNIADATVASWKQIGDVSVTFQCTPSNLLSIAGNATLDGGTWTHTGPAANPSTMINVSVGGNLAVGADASIQAGRGSDSADYRSRGFARGSGPGYKRDAGGSFAGDGGHPSNTVDFVSYGSILDPLSYGSGGWGNSELYAGGGIVKLAVGGTLTVDGTICSRGFGWPLDQENTIGGAGSGGSVNITAGALAGSGRIDANGGSNGLLGPGSGGRMKIALTGTGASFDAFTGTIEAVGGYMQNNDQAKIHDLSPAAAGTVCLVAPGDRPVVRVANEFRYADADTDHWRVAEAEGAVPSATHIPSKEGGDVLSNVRWELSGHGALRVTKDVRTYSLSLASNDGSQCVYTDGKVLTVKELAIAGTTKRAGRYTAAELPNIVVGNGAIVVDFMPTVIVVR